MNDYNQFYSNILYVNNNNDDYLIQLEKELGEKFNELGSGNSCPIYGFRRNFLTMFDKKSFERLIFIIFWIEYIYIK